MSGWAMPPVCDEVMASMLVLRPAWAWVTRQASAAGGDVQVGTHRRGSDVASAPASCRKSGGKGAQEMY